MSNLRSNPGSAGGGGDEPGPDRGDSDADPSRGGGGQRGEGSESAPLTGAQRTRDAGRVARLVEVLRTADRCYAEAVDLLAELDGSGIVEREEGLTVDVLLGVAAGLPGPDRGMLAAAAGALADLPATAAALRAGRISWGQLRAIVRACKRRSKADRAAIDARVGATVTDPHRSDDPDQLIWAVEACAEQLREERERARSEKRALLRSFLSVQPGLDGGARVYGELTALDAAPILSALDTAARHSSTSHAAEARPDGASPAGDTDRGATTGDETTQDGPDRVDAEGLQGSGAGWSATPRSREYAKALAQLCTDWLTTGSYGGQPRAPRTAITCHIDLSHAAAQPDGTVHLSLRGDLPRVTAAAVEALAADGATVRVLLSDGQRPLALSDAKRIPARVRSAVAARDQGCRMPACAAPAAWTDLHHFRLPQALGRDHEPDGLSAFCRTHHRLIERRGWELRMHRHTGQISFLRDDRRWTSLPNGTPLSPAPPGDPPDGAPF